MKDATKLRCYIDQAIMMRDYAALAVFEDRLAILEEPDGLPIEHGGDEPLCSGSA